MSHKTPVVCLFLLTALVWSPASVQAQTPGHPNSLPDPVPPPLPPREKPDDARSYEPIVPDAKQVTLLGKVIEVRRNLERR